MTDLLLHIGYHKTASTWLQRRLFSDPVGNFFRPGDPRELMRQIALVDDLQFDPDRTRAYFHDEIGKDLEVANDRVLVLSNERLSGNPHSGGYDSKAIADRLEHVFPGANVFIVIREQRSMIVSCWKQYVQIGGAGSMRSYIRGAGRYAVPQFRLEYFEYHRLIAHYQKLFGREKVLVLPVEMLARDRPRFVSRIADFAGSAAPALSDTTRENVSLSGFACTLKRRPNWILVRNGVNPAAPIASPWLNDQILSASRWVDRRAPDPVLQAWDRWQARYATRIAGSRFANSNRETERLTGLDLAGYGYDC